MEARNCVRCGRVFVSPGRALCSDCVRQEQDEYQRVKGYLAENPKASVIEVSRETGVPTERIHQFVREGRLVASDPDSDLVVRCEVCGAPITRGRVCATCLHAWKEAGRRAPPEEPQPPQPAWEGPKARIYLPHRYRRRP